MFAREIFNLAYYFFFSNKPNTVRLSVTLKRKCSATATPKANDRAKPNQAPFHAEMELL